MQQNSGLLLLKSIGVEIPQDMHRVRHACDARKGGACGWPAIFFVHIFMFRIQRRLDPSATW